MRDFVRILIFAALLGASFAPGVGWGAQAVPRATLEEVTGAIMSPACPGKLLINCPSAEGAQLRELVRRKLAAGETKEQIVRYFVEVYGIESLPTPPAEGFYLTAWLLPFATLAAGIGVFLVMVWSWSAKARARRAAGGGAPGVPKAGAARGDSPLEARLQRELDDYES